MTDTLNTDSAILTFSTDLGGDGVPAGEVCLIPGDLDLDGDVDFADFVAFASNYGRTGPRPTSHCDALGTQ